MALSSSVKADRGPGVGLVEKHALETHDPAPEVTLRALMRPTCGANILIIVAKSVVDKERKKEKTQ